MTHENHDTEKTELDGLLDTEDEENPTISTQLLRFHDDLNNLLGEQDFYRVSISSLFQQEDCDVLYTERQRTGMERTARSISEKGSELSDRLRAIRERIKGITKQLG